MRNIIESIQDLQHPIQGRRVRSMNRVHWLLLVASLTWCGSILAAPLIESRALYAFFSAICHQNPARSWFLGGEPLGVCIRCASIYAGFLVALAAGIRPRTWLLRVSVLLLGVEFTVARLGIDLEGPRAVSGLLLGLAAGGFLEQGLQELIHDRVIGKVRSALRSAT